MRSRVGRVTSADGTEIAFERSGEGPPVVLVSAALQTRAMYRPVAQELAPDFAVFCYDRRGRGESGDTQPYAVEREIEDLAAILEETGGAAAVYGHSSGAALVLRAAAYGLPITCLVLHEPPYTREDDEEQRRSSREDAEAIQALLAEDRRGDAISHILNGIGVPPEAVAEMICDEGMLEMAHTLAYDSEIMDDAKTGGTIPFDTIERVEIPTLVLLGGESPEWMIEVGKQTADALPNGRHKILDGQDHFAPPEVLALTLKEFFERV